MERIEIEALDTTTNSPVLLLPGRRFPGLLIQGDSLHILYSLARALQTQLTATSHIDANDDKGTPLELAEELSELLHSYLSKYEQALRAHLDIR
jgi:hypothetical protein